jgi:hypothetical protein
MHTTQPQARDGADLQIGDTVHYENTFWDTHDIGIIVGIYQVRGNLYYYVFNRTPTDINMPIVDQNQIIERINTDYRGMTPQYILALHDAAHITIGGS